MMKASSQEEPKVYDPLWEENSKVRRIRAESEAEGFAEGKAKGRVEGKAEGLQIALVSAVRVRFPELAELAQQKVIKINDTSNLDMLLKQVITAQDERTARWLLIQQMRNRNAVGTRFSPSASPAFMIYKYWKTWRRTG